LSPALAALLLRGEEHKYAIFDWTGIGWLSRGYRKFAHGVDAAIQGMARGYGKTICRVLSYRYAMVVLFLAGLAATAYMYVHVPTGFVPQEDQNYFIVVVQAPQGASLAYTTDVAKQAEQILRADPDVFGTFAVPGFSLSGGSSSNYGLIFAPLKPIDDRKGKGHAVNDIVARVAPKLFSVPGAIVVPFEPPATRLWAVVASGPTCKACSPASRPMIRSSWCRSIGKRPRPSECRSVKSRRRWAFTWVPSTSMISTSITVRIGFTYKPISRFA
jgi:HAE1 family hydrophobic/amphiphilic exporter-1